MAEAGLKSSYIIRSCAFSTTAQNDFQAWWANVWSPSEGLEWENGYRKQLKRLKSLPVSEQCLDSGRKKMERQKDSGHTLKACSLYQHIIPPGSLLEMQILSQKFWAPDSLLNKPSWWLCWRLQFENYCSDLVILSLACILEPLLD